MRGCLLCICGLLLLQGLNGEDRPEDVFSRIYRDHVWGSADDGFGSSGGGSSLESTARYRALLQDFLSRYEIRSVVDVGCGDWEFSQAINWEGIDYIGYEVVPQLIIKNRERFESSNIHFIQGDALEVDLPCADLLICKEVLQHLTNEDIKTFIKQLGKFKYCLITDDVGVNIPIKRGETRGIDLTRPPFFLKGSKILSYKAFGRVKQVLFIRQEKL